jgi:hypothetical protein
VGAAVDVDVTLNPEKVTDVVTVDGGMTVETSRTSTPGQ